MAIYDKYIYTKSGTPFMDQFSTLKAGYEKQLANETAQMNQRQEREIADSNKTYDANARTNYINYMQSRKNLPSQLNSLGIRGGASESSLLRLGTTYGQNVAANEGARASAQDAIRQTYAQQIQDMRNNYNNRIVQAEADAKKNQLEWETTQLDKDLQRFSGTIQGLYKKKSSYEKLIKKLEASSDPNKKYKIALARQAMNQLEDSGSSGSGSGSGRRSGGRRGYSSGSGYYSDTSTVETESTPKTKTKQTKTKTKTTTKTRTTAKKSSAIASRMRRARSKAYSKKIYKWFR